MTLTLLLALSAAPQPKLQPVGDQQAVRITLEKLQTLGDRLSQRQASSRDLAEQERQMVGTLADLQFALDEAKRATRLASQRVRDTEDNSTSSRPVDRSAAHDAARPAASSASARAAASSEPCRHG